MTRQQGTFLSIALFLVGGVVATKSLVVGVILIVAAVAVVAWTVTLDRTPS